MAVLQAIRNTVATIVAGDPAARLAALADKRHQLDDELQTARRGVRTDSHVSEHARRQEGMYIAALVDQLQALAAEEAGLRAEIATEQRAKQAEAARAEQARLADLDALDVPGLERAAEEAAQRARRLADQESELLRQSNASPAGWARRSEAEALVLDSELAVTRAERMHQQQRRERAAVRLQALRSEATRAAAAASPDRPPTTAELRAQRDALKEQLSGLQAGREEAAAELARYSDMVGTWAGDGNSASAIERDADLRRHRDAAQAVVERLDNAIAQQQGIIADLGRAIADADRKEQAAAAAPILADLARELDAVAITLGRLGALGPVYGALGGLVRCVAAARAALPR